MRIRGGEKQFCLRVKIQHPSHYKGEWELKIYSYSVEIKFFRNKIIDN